MLGKTADALTAYMGTAILAEVGQTDGAQWVIFARALDQQEPAGEDIVHVQMGGPGTQVLGQRGGLETDKTTYDCAFLWAIEITPDEDERFVRLDPEGEVFDTAPELAPLLPFTLEEPDLPEDLEDDAGNPNLNPPKSLADTIDPDTWQAADSSPHLDELDDLDPGSATKH